MVSPTKTFVFRSNKQCSLSSAGMMILFFFYMRETMRLTYIHSLQYSELTENVVYEEFFRYDPTSVLYFLSLINSQGMRDVEGLLTSDRMLDFIEYKNNPRSWKFLDVDTIITDFCVGQCISGPKSYENLTGILRLIFKNAENDGAGDAKNITDLLEGLNSDIQRIFRPENSKYQLDLSNKLDYTDGVPTLKNLTEKEVTNMGIKDVTHQTTTGRFVFEIEQKNDSYHLKFYTTPCILITLVDILGDRERNLLLQTDKEITIPPSFYKYSFMTERSAFGVSNMEFPQLIQSFCEEITNAKDKNQCRLFLDIVARSSIVEIKAGDVSRDNYIGLRISGSNCKLFLLLDFMFQQLGSTNVIKLPPAAFLNLLQVSFKLEDRWFKNIKIWQEEKRDTAKIYNAIFLRAF